MQANHSALKPWIVRYFAMNLYTYLKSKNDTVLAAC